MINDEDSIIIVPAACLSKKISSKRSTGAAADRDGKRFESVLSRIIRNGGKLDEEKEIQQYICNAVGIDTKDVKYATEKANKIAKGALKCRIKTDVLITSQDGYKVGLSLKNTKCATVGVFETSLDSWFDKFKVEDKNVKNAFEVYRDKCRFRYTELREKYPDEYLTIKDYFQKNIDTIMKRLICGFDSNSNTTPKYIVFYDKRYKEITCLSVDEYISIAKKEHSAQFEVPLSITRASGHKGSSPKIKIKIFNPIYDLHKMRSKI